ncbi:glycosyltransferase family 2 protein [Nocardioides sp. YIM 152588]|uniref:glycosyltransferase family 2 protein n=1 Tax=Nocardioides sp. YIM 152588 TaxID=3158259 RepID=UPI0032E382F7
MRFQRFIGLLVLGAALLGAGLLWVSVGASDPEPAAPPERGVLFGIWRIFYETEIPPVDVIVAAIGVALLLAAAVALLERRISDRTRRSWDVAALPLAPRLVMDETHGVYAGPVTVTVLIPAHDEEACLGATLASLRAQSVPPDRIIVVADNCTDGTVALARAAGVEVFETDGNRRKKAGALNQVLEVLLPGQGDNDTVMVLDADTILDQGFLAGAIRRLTDDRALMAVGGLFYGDQGGGLIGQFQRNEYTRYQRDLKRRRGRVFVLTGTASVFRPWALREVAAQRGRALPGVPGDVYDTVALTEDNELTIALKTLGALIISPAECTVVTEVMPSWRTLWSQRLRWQRGALENLGAYGLRPSTVRYWAQQLGLGYGVFALGSYLLLILLMAVSTDTWVWFPFWLGIGGVFTLERVVTVWRGGWRARLLAVTLFPELYYAMFLNVAFVKGVWDMSLAREASWKHLPGPGTATGGPIEREMEAEHA